MENKLVGNPTFPDRTKASQDIINLLEKHSFSGYGTGGGCMAMRKEFDSGVACFVTDNDAGIDNLDVEIVIGFEDADGEPIELESTYNNGFHHSKANNILSEIYRLETNLINAMPNSIY